MGKVILVCGKICSGKSYYSNQLKNPEDKIESDLSIFLTK